VHMHLMRQCYLSATYPSAYCAAIFEPATCKYNTDKPPRVQEMVGVGGREVVMALK
jgi:hypothetical protein